MQLQQFHISKKERNKHYSTKDMQKAIVGKGDKQTPQQKANKKCRKHHQTQPITKHDPLKT